MTNVKPKTIPDSKEMSALTYTGAFIFPGMEVVRTVVRVTEAGPVDLTAEQKADIVSALFDLAAIHHANSERFQQIRVGSLNPHVLNAEEDREADRRDAILTLIDKLAPVVTAEPIDEAASII